jgi:hypothetical protein
MKQLALGVLFTAVASGAAAQDGRRDRGVPAGHLPPPGECRVWYPDRPAGHQPPPTSCSEARRIARRDGARVVYGGGRDDRDYDRGDDRDRRDRDSDRRDRDRDGDWDRRDRDSDRQRDGDTRRRWPWPF